MKLSSRGIVLHTINYSETSLVVKIYTEQSGMGSFIVSGVRSKKGKFSTSHFQPLTLIEFNALGKPGQSMLRITDVHLAPPFSGIPGDMIKSTIALFIAEVIYRSVREEEVNPSLFNFLHNGIQFLDLSHNNCARFHIYFMIQFSRYLGFYPNGIFISDTSYFDLREGLFRNDKPVHADFFDIVQTATLYKLMNSSFDNFHEAAIPAAISKTLLYGLVTYFEIHQTHGHQIRSHKVLEEVLS
ncbi:MAG: DNA repair protein RecO [Bacteroidetes bacterium]|nr:DNA repair protein RecO [Bacteroidota bacterium]